MSEYNHRNDTQSLTATDISAIYSLADRLQPAAFWGRLKRVHTSSIDGFEVLHPETDLPMFKIGRRLAGGYVAQEDGGRELASGGTMDDALRPWCQN